MTGDAATSLSARKKSRRDVLDAKAAAGLGEREVWVIITALAGAVLALVRWISPQFKKQEAEIASLKEVVADLQALNQEVTSELAVANARAEEREKVDELRSQRWDLERKNLHQEVEHLRAAMTLEREKFEAERGRLVERASRKETEAELRTAESAALHQRVRELENLAERDREGDGG